MILSAGQAQAPRPTTADGGQYRRLLQQGHAVDSAMRVLRCSEEDIASYLLYCSNFGINNATVLSLASASYALCIKLALKR